jgi:hypothetical protein
VKALDVDVADAGRVGGGLQRAEHGQQQARAQVEAEPVGLGGHGHGASEQRLTRIGTLGFEVTAAHGKQAAHATHHTAWHKMHTQGR